METKLGIKVNAFFAPDYAGIIQGMRFNKVDIARYGNLSAMEAVDRANGGVRPDRCGRRLSGLLERADC